MDEREMAALFAEMAERYEKGIRLAGEMPGAEAVTGADEENDDDDGPPAGGGPIPEGVRNQWRAGRSFAAAAR